MKIDKAPVVIVSRVGYDLLLEKGNLISPLKDRTLIFIHSTRTSHLPPISAATELHLIELRECNDYLTELIRTIKSRHKICQILTISEQDLTPVVVARNVLGFPSIGIDQAALYRDKFRMKTALSGTDIAIPEFAKGTDDIKITKLFEKHFKLIVKPVEGYGAQDTSTLASKNDVINFLKRPEATRERYIVEVFITGDIYHLDAVVRKGEILFSSLGKYETPPLEFIGRRWGGTRFSNAKDQIHVEARSQLSKILTAFKTYDGVFHYEFFLHKSELVFGEIAIRPAGGGVSDAIYDTFEVHLVEEHIRIQLGMESAIATPISNISYGASLLLLSEAPGVVSHYAGLEQPSYTSLRRVNIHYNKGEKVSLTRYSADCLLTCSLSNKDWDLLNRDINAIQSRVKAVLEKKD